MLPLYQLGHPLILINHQNRAADCGQRINQPVADRPFTGVSHREAGIGLAGQSVGFTDFSFNNLNRLIATRNPAQL
jgi:hypothetical protein